MRTSWEKEFSWESRSGFRDGERTEMGGIKVMNGKVSSKLILKIATVLWVLTSQFNKSHLFLIIGRIGGKYFRM